MSDSVRPHRRQPTRLPHPWDFPGKNTGVDCHFLLQCMKVKSESEVTQSCPTLSDPMDCSPPGSSVHGIFQARVLEWVANAFSIGSQEADITEVTEHACTHVVYTHNGILFSLQKKVILSDAITWMILEDVMPSEISQYCMVLLTQAIKTFKLIDA